MMTRTLLLGCTLVVSLAAAQRGGRGGAPPDSKPTPPADARIEKLKQDAAAEADAMRVFAQQMVDQVFSYGELGFQEIETSKYLTGVLEKNGFAIQNNLSGIPTAWM